MRRSGALWPIVLTAVAALAILAQSMSDHRDLAFTLGVDPIGVAAKLWPNDRVCQRPLTAEEDFRAVQVRLGAVRPAALDVSVLPPGGGRPLVSVREETPAGLEHLRATFPESVRQDTRFELCVRNRGEGVLAVYGEANDARRLTVARGDGLDNPADLSLVFFRERSRSALWLVPEMFERASLFKPQFVGPWTFWLLLALVVVAVPAMLAAALRSATD